MITKHEYAKIRRMYFRDNIPIAEIGRRLSIARNTVRKWLRAPDGYSPTYRRIPTEKIIKPFEPWLLQALEFDSALPKRDRRNALKLFEAIRQKGFTGNYSRVTEFVYSWCVHGGGIAKEPTPSVDMQRWMMWLYLLERQHKSHSGNESLMSINSIYEALNPSPNSQRTKALVVLAKLEGFTVSQIAKHLAIARVTVRGYLEDFLLGGSEGLFKGTMRAKKSQNPDLKKCIFTLLHEPPSLHGFNRTTWRMDDLRDSLSKYGHSVGDQIIRDVIKEAGYRWKSAKVVLTSNDPDYREKYQHIQDILSSLKNDERFFSIDEFGPFAVKMKAGRVLVEPGAQPTVPQWQKSKGWLILTAALELSRNQVTHFYSKAKNSEEMIRMTKALIQQYAEASKLYISWDAASWHISKALKKYIKEHNEKAEIEQLPLVELAPLPASAQFLNVIESVFSGMARAIIHNSDYQSTNEAMDAIDRHFKERNQNFLDNPKRAGHKIWGMERSSSEFSASNNCKDPAYR